VVEQQHRAGGVRLQATRLDLGLGVEHDALVAESDPEVLQAPVSAAVLGQRVVELVAEHGGGVAAGGPDAGFAAGA
jgi:hypothetical protein